MMLHHHVPQDDYLLSHDFHKIVNLQGPILPLWIAYIRRIIDFVFLLYAYAQASRINFSMGRDLIKGSVHVFGYRTKCYRQEPLENVEDLRNPLKIVNDGQRLRWAMHSKRSYKPSLRLRCYNPKRNSSNSQLESICVS